jgi:RNA-directed DNA polymerase
VTPLKETRRAEGRGRPEGNLREEARDRTQSRVALPSHLARVNAAARRAVQTRFTALLHHVDVEALERAFRRQKRQASAGVDGITVADYEQNLEANLQDLCARVHTGRYRPQPVRRVYIPKADGGRRPLGVPTLEDKIVQGAVAETLSAIYEVDRLSRPTPRRGSAAPPPRPPSSGSPTAFGRGGTRTRLCHRCIRRS